MYFANPWGLLGLLAIPLILFIHLFQRKFPPLEVGGLHLWLSDEQVKTSGLRRDRLPVTKTLVLELLIAGLLAMLLAQPRLSDLSSTTHWVFVLDNSASMLATPQSRQSFRDLALAEIESRVDESGRNTRVTLIMTGPRPTMLAGPAVSWSEAKTAAESWQPQKTRHQFQSAWDMASQLADKSGRLVFLTDDKEQFSGIPSNMELVSVGDSLPNLAFETARWSIDADSLEASLYLRVRNHSTTPLNAEIVGSVDGQEIFRQDAKIAAGASLPLATPLPGGIKSLDLEIESPDDRLQTDSQLTLIEPGLRTIKYSIQLPSDHPAKSSVDRFLKSATNIQSVDDVEDADFVVSALDQFDGEQLPDNVWQLLIGPADMAQDVRQSADVTTGPFLLDRRNPVLDGLDPQGLIWAGHQGVNLSQLPLISVDKKVLLGEHTGTAHRCFVLDIDFASSNLVDSPTFPILMSNLIESCRRDKPGLQRWNYHLNELVNFKVRPEDLNIEGAEALEPLQLIHETGSRNLPRLSPIELPPLSATGIYEVKDGQRSLGRFAVNFFDALESDLNGLDGGTEVPAESLEQTFKFEELAPWVWMLLIAFAIGLAFWNWASLRSGRSRNGGLDSSRQGTGAPTP